MSQKCKISVFTLGHSEDHDINSERKTFLIGDKENLMPAQYNQGS